MTTRLYPIFFFVRPDSGFLALATKSCWRSRCYTPLHIKPQSFDLKDDVVWKIGGIAMQGDVFLGLCEFFWEMGFWGAVLWIRYCDRAVGS